MLLAVEQLAGGADPGVADQGTGPHGRFRGEEVAGGISGGCDHTPDCRRNAPGARTGEGPRVQVVSVSAASESGKNDFGVSVG